MAAFDLGTRVLSTNSPNGETGTCVLPVPWGAQLGLVSSGLKSQRPSTATWQGSRRSVSLVPPQALGCVL
jgi:hypothetical protein